MLLVWKGYYEHMNTDLIESVDQDLVKPDSVQRWG